MRGPSSAYRDVTPMDSTLSCFSSLQPLVELSDPFGELMHCSLFPRCIGIRKGYSNESLHLTRTGYQRCNRSNRTLGYVRHIVMVCRAGPGVKASFVTLADLQKLDQASNLLGWAARIAWGLWAILEHNERGSTRAAEHPKESSLESSVKALTITQKGGTYD